MVVRRKRQVRKRRGGRKHGWGAEHRGSGQKGGAGNAGSGKRAQSKKPSFWHVEKKKGFPGQKKPNVITTKDLDRIIDKLVQEGKATKEGNTYKIELEKAGYDKLISKGKTGKKIVVTGKMSKGAQAKLE